MLPRATIIPVVYWTVLLFLLQIHAIYSTEKQPKMIHNSTNHTTRPVIGVITQVLRDYKRFVPDRRLHLASSYVKWIEGAGARALPILLNQDDDYYRKVFQQTNGLLFPGGDNMLDPNQNTPMMVAAKKLYKLAVEANDNGDFYPIWGTCLGLELLSVLSSGKNVLEDCLANDMVLNMTFVTRGRLFAPSNYADLVDGYDFAGSIVRALTSKNLTYHFHHKCFTDRGLERANLTDFYRPIAHSTDSLGNRFITIMEAINYPFYGVQFHPEKAPYEFTVSEKQQNIPHSKEAIAVSRYFADFFVAASRSSNHQANEDDQDFIGSLIYSNDPMYTGLKNDMYEQRYLFPFSPSDETVTSEFLDRKPEENEEVPEDVGLKSHTRPTPTLIDLTDYDNIIDKAIKGHESVKTT